MEGGPPVFSQDNTCPDLLFPTVLNLALVDLKGDGVVTAKIYDGKILRSVQSQSINATDIASEYFTSVPSAPAVYQAQQPLPITFKYHDIPDSYAITLEVTCSADAKLAAVALDFNDSNQARPTTANDKLIDLTTQSYRFIGFVRPDETFATLITGCAGRTVTLHDAADRSYAANGGKKLFTPANIAMRFTAANNRVNISSGATGYDYETLLAALAASKKSDGLFFLGDIGGERYFAHAFETAKLFGEPIHAVLGPGDQTSIAQNADYISQSGKPVRYLVETDYINFYCLSIPLAEADMERDSDGNLIGTTPEEMTETGRFYRWMQTKIARNPGKFNIMVVGYPPYSATPTFTPGFAALRWNFKKLGVHAVIANGRCYERFYEDGIYYFNVGTGAKAALLESGGIASPGILSVYATPNILTFEFNDTDTELRDHAIILI